MGETIGYNPAEMAVNLYEKHEAHIHEVIKTKHEQLNQVVTQMEDLEFFLRKVKEQSELFQKDKKHKIEISHADAELIKRLSEQEKLSHIFTPSKFTWEDEEIVDLVTQCQKAIGECCEDENIKRLIEERIQGPMQREISMKTEEILYEQQELIKSLEIFRSIQKEASDAIRFILQNIQRH